MTWRTPAAALALGLLLGAFAAWRLLPRPAPAVHLVEASHEVASLAQRVEEGAGRTTITEFAPACAGPMQLVPGPLRTVPGPERLVPVPGPERVVRQTVIERGPVVTVTAATVESETHRELVVTPAAPPAWAVSAGAQLLPDQRLEVGLEHRLLGPVWARAWALQPLALAAPAVGVGLRVEW